MNIILAFLAGAALSDTQISKGTAQTIKIGVVVIAIALLIAFRYAS